MGFYPILIYTLIILPSISSAQVSRRDSTVTWSTYYYTLNENNTLATYSLNPDDIVIRTFSAVVLENEYLRVTLVPEFGGRILSMIYKPTGHEQLYQNLVGAPYGMQWGDTFYYRWLMLYGGIFPTLTEPEHGKAWLLPWDHEIIKETPDTISVRMSWQDTVNLFQNYRWKYGATNILCDFVVSLIAGRTALEVDIQLQNNSNDNLQYEFWTNTGMAPGSTPGDARCTSGAEIILPVSKIKIPNYWTGIASQEQPVFGENEVYIFNALRMYENWVDQGIAYAWPEVTTNFWGVINHDNDEGIIRISDNLETPGVKIWTFGHDISSTINPFNPPPSYYYYRPFIELWAGVSREFFVAYVLPANSIKSWKEIYTPTIGLTNVTHASENIIADFRIGSSVTGDIPIATLDFFATAPFSDINTTISITGQIQETLFDSTLTTDPVSCHQITVALPVGQIWNESDSLICMITGPNSETFLSGSIPLSSETPTDVGNIYAENNLIKSFKLYQNYPNPFNPSTTISYSLSTTKMVSLKVFDMLGREVTHLVDEEKSAGHHAYLFEAKNLPSGLYFYRLEVGSFSETRKMLLFE